VSEKGRTDAATSGGRAAHQQKRIQRDNCTVQSPQFGPLNVVRRQGVWLAFYVELLEVDFRDVIVAGEYENVAGTLVCVRDLTLAFRVSV
jgi:hypothetical protein